MDWINNLRSTVAEKAALVCQRGAIGSAVSTAGFSGVAAAQQAQQAQPVMIGGIGLSEWGLIISAVCAVAMTVGSLGFKYLAYLQVKQAAQAGRLTVTADGD